MKRLADRFVTERIGIPQWEGQDISELGHKFFILNREVKKAVAECPIVDTTNCEYFLKDKTINLYKDFPCVMAPWDEFWMEYRAMSATNNPRAVGGYFTVQETSMDKPCSGDYFNTVDWVEEQTRPNTAQFVDLSIYFLQTDDSIAGPMGVFHLAIDKQGNLLEIAYNLPPMYKYGELINVPEFMAYTLAPFLQALSFMHCKNVVLETTVPNPKLSKKHAKRNGGQPLLKYHTIGIETMGQTIRRLKGQGGTGEPVSLHIVPGHFAHYGSEYGRGKLFGKYEGRFWIPSHVRGNASVGEVKTDYEVRT